MPEWFYAEEDNTKGPISKEELLTLERTGTVSETTLVWEKSMKEWKRFREVFSSSSIDSTVPPLPKRQVTTETNFIRHEIVLRDDSKIQVRSSLKRAWKLMRSDFWPIVGICAVGSILVGVALQFYVTVFFLMIPAVAGVYYFCLLKLRNQEASIEVLFDGFRRNFGDLAVINLVTAIPSLAIVIAAIVAIVMGASNQPVDWWLAMVLTAGGLVSVALLCWIGFLGVLATAITIDNGTGAKESLALATRASLRHWCKGPIFYALTMVLAFSGLLLLYFGSFVTSTWATLASVWVYEDLFFRTPDSGSPSD